MKKRKLKGNHVPRIVYYFLGFYDDKRNLIYMDETNEIIFVQRRQRDFNRHVRDFIVALNYNIMPYISELTILKEKYDLLNEDYHNLIINQKLDFSYIDTYSARYEIESQKIKLSIFERKNNISD